MYTISSKIENMCYIHVSKHYFKSICNQSLCSSYCAQWSSSQWLHLCISSPSWYLKVDHLSGAILQQIPMYWAFLVTLCHCRLTQLCTRLYWPPIPMDHLLMCIPQHSGIICFLPLVLPLYNPCRIMYCSLATTYIEGGVVQSCVHCMVLCDRLWCINVPWQE